MRATARVSVRVHVSEGGSEGVSEEKGEGDSEGVSSSKGPPTSSHVCLTLP